MSAYFTYESALIRLGFSAFSSVFDGFSVFIVNFRSTWMNSSCRVTYRWNGSKNDEFGVKMKKMKIWRLVRKTSRRDLRNQHTSRRDVKVSRRDPGFSRTQKFQELLAVCLAVVSRRDDTKKEASRREDGWRAARRRILTKTKSNFDLILAVGSFFKAQISPKLYFDLNHYKT